LTIRPATPSDLALITALVRELADYERLAHEAVATEADFAAALFDMPSKAHALIVESDGRAAGFALYFYNFSTFVGRPGIYVEDVFIRPEFRRNGFGAAVFKYLARKAVAENCGRMEWSVLDWNEPAIRFYAGLGAKPMDAWTIQRLTGDALRNFAESPDHA
jgi:GNAT superfamily N-acetyltransferase